MAEHTCMSHRRREDPGVPVTTLLLGGCWKERAPEAFSDEALPILDVDGVMLDAERSHGGRGPRALQLVPDLARRTQRALRALKRVGGFNNDFLARRPAPRPARGGGWIVPEERRAVGFPGRRSAHPGTGSPPASGSSRRQHAEDAPPGGPPSPCSNWRPRAWNWPSARGVPRRNWTLAFQVLGFELPAVCGFRAPFPQAHARWSPGAGRSVSRPRNHLRGDTRTMPRPCASPGALRPEHPMDLSPPSWPASASGRAAGGFSGVSSLRGLLSQISGGHLLPETDTSRRDAGACWERGPGGPCLLGGPMPRP